MEREIERHPGALNPAYHIAEKISASSQQLVFPNPVLVESEAGEGEGEKEVRSSQSVLNHLVLFFISFIL